MRKPLTLIGAKRLARRYARMCGIPFIVGQDRDGAPYWVSHDAARWRAAGFVVVCEVAP